MVGQARDVWDPSQVSFSHTVICITLISAVVLLNFSLSQIVTSLMQMVTLTAVAAMLVEFTQQSQTS